MRTLPLLLALASLTVAKDDPVERAIRAGYAAEVDISGVTVNPDGSQVGYVGCGTIIHPAGYILTNAHVGSHAMIERRGVIRLKAGKHPIRVEWIEGNGAEGLKVSISGPGVDKKEIPATMLFQER